MVVVLEMETLNVENRYFLQLRDYILKIKNFTCMNLLKILSRTSKLNIILNLNTFINQIKALWS
jgi:hypothetical protein